MISELHDTTVAKVNDFLVSQRESGGVVTLGRVLTLVIVADGPSTEEAIEAASVASREHPSRVIVLVADPDDDENRIDAEVRVGSDAGAGEIVILTAKGDPARAVDTLVNPLLLPDAPIVTWWSGDAPAVPSREVLGRMAQRRITDANASSDPEATLANLRLGYELGDTDLTWTRLTIWRGLIASSLETAPRTPVTGVTVTGNPHNPSVKLMSAWLADRLEAPVDVVAEGEGGLVSVTIHRDGHGDLEVRRRDDENVVLNLPGDKSDQFVALPRRTLSECLSEELRRLDPDETYGRILHLTGSDEDSAAAERVLSRPVPRDIIAADPDALADAAARYVVGRLREAVIARGAAHLVLTGGGVGVKTARALLSAARLSAFSFADVHIWWGDERFVAVGDAERNDAQVEEFLAPLHLPAEQIHRMPAPSPDAASKPASEDASKIRGALSQAASDYAAELEAAGYDEASDEPFFDVLLLGMGPDGHVASLFPRHPAQRECTAPTVAVAGSPKPPSERISLTFTAIDRCRTLVLLVAGAEKADATAKAHGLIDPWHVPASAVRGTDETVWFLDRAANSGGSSTASSNAA